MADASSVERVSQTKLDSNPKYFSLSSLPTLVQTVPSLNSAFCPMICCDNVLKCLKEKDWSPTD